MYLDPAQELDLHLSTTISFQETLNASAPHKRLQGQWYDINLGEDMETAWVPHSDICTRGKRMNILLRYRDLPPKSDSWKSIDLENCQDCI